MALGQSSSRGTYELVGGLGLEIEDVEFEALTHVFSPAFTRLTTRVALRGRGFEGTGEDVTPFEPAHQGAAGGSGPLLDL